MNTAKLVRKGQTFKDVTGLEFTVLDTAIDFGRRTYRVRVAKDGAVSTEWLTQEQIRLVVCVN